MSDELVRQSVSLRDGRTAHLFVNLDRGLIVLDVVDKDEGSGYEIARINVNEKPFMAIIGSGGVRYRLEDVAEIGEMAEKSSPRRGATRRSA